MRQVMVILALVHARELFVGRVMSVTEPSVNDQLRIDLPHGAVFVTVGEVCHGAAFPQNCDLAVSVIDRRGEREALALAEALRQAPLWRIFEYTSLEGFVPPEWLSGRGVPERVTRSAA
jgi:hypothetical protein